MVTVAQSVVHGLQPIAIRYQGHLDLCSLPFVVFLVPESFKSSIEHGVTLGERVLLGTLVFLLLVFGEHTQKRVAHWENTEQESKLLIILEVCEAHVLIGVDLLSLLPIKPCEGAIN